MNPLKYFQTRHLASRLIIMLTLIIVIAEAIFGWASVRNEEELLLNSMVEGADQLSGAITSSTWHAMLADQRSSAYEIMQTIALKQGIDRIRIFNKEGRVMFSTNSEMGAQVDKKAEECYLCHATDQPLVRLDVPSRARVYRGTDGTRKLAMVTPIYNEPSCSDADCHAHPNSIAVLGVLDVSLNLADVDAEVASVTNRIVVNTIIEVTVIGFLIIVFSRQFVHRPIRKLIDGTRAVSAMNLDVPVHVGTKGELGELAQSFDEMRKRLKEALEKINEFTQSLEAKVRERTDQLQLAHQKLLQTDRLASLGQLAASVAHEINNPIAGVVNLGMLMQRIVKDDGIPMERVPEVKRYLSQVVNETSRAGRIVSDLLAFSRRSTPQRSLANLNAIIRSTLSIIDHKLTLMNVKLDLHLEEKLPPVRCDSSQIQQVLINLVMNGGEAMQSKGGGVLCVQTRIDEAKHIAILEVIDTGDGISPEHLPKIFDPFYTTKGVGKGVGLGLAVVYGIVEAHRGEIDVESLKGKGTTFRMTLPLDGIDPPEKNQSADLHKERTD